jgi:hypothetical protein
LITVATDSCAVSLNSSIVVAKLCWTDARLPCRLHKITWQYLVYEMMPINCNRHSQLELLKLNLVVSRQGWDDKSSWSVVTCNPVGFRKMNSSYFVRQFAGSFFVVSQTLLVSAGRCLALGGPCGAYQKHKETQRRTTSQ